MTECTSKPSAGNDLTEVGRSLYMNYYVEDSAVTTTYNTPYFNQACLYQNTYYRFDCDTRASGNNWVFPAGITFDETGFTFPLSASSNNNEEPVQ